MEKYKISKQEKDALLFGYYSSLYGLHHYKGLRYKQCLRLVKNIKKISNERRNDNIDDFIEVYDDSGVLDNET